MDPDLVELVRMEAEEFVRGSFLEGAPVVPVSAVSGQGLSELRDALSSQSQRVSVKDASRWFRLPMDRCFPPGFGTIVTGTLVSGSVADQREVEIHPLGRIAGSAASRSTERRRPLPPPDSARR